MIDRDDLERTLTELMAIDPEGELFPPGTNRLLKLALPVAPARKWLFVTKTCAFELLCHETEMPAEVGVVQYAGMVSGAIANLVATLAVGAQVAFVGDLDPFDLLAFHTLRVGGLGGAPAALPRVDLAGVNDRWVRLSDAWRRANSPRWTITMDEVENAHFARLESLGLTSVLGPLSRGLLRAGKKLELEGASGPAFHRPGFRDALRALLSE